MKITPLWALAPLAATCGLHAVVAAPKSKRAPLVRPRTTLAQFIEERPREIGGQMRVVVQNDAASETAQAANFCALTHTDVRAKISGSVALVTVEQQFSNPSKTPVEAVYTFPLPERAAVNAMEFRVGARVVQGEIKRREVARQIYNAAKTEGKRAALLDEERPNIFTQSVANILPGDKITVRISFVQPLEYRGGAYEWAFPTVVGPRYSASGGYVEAGKRGVGDAAKITPPVALPGTRAGHDLSLSVDVDAGVPITAIRSVLHPVSVAKSGPNRAHVALINAATLPNQDFVLRFAVAGQQVQSGLITQSDGQGGGYFALVMQPPKTPQIADISPRELVFVIDQTGSQGGWPIEKSKEAMRYALARLRPKDTFQLLGFNTDVFPCFDAPVAPTAANLAKARHFIDAINAGGGTDILKALDAALKMPDDPARLRIVAYLTDGYVQNDEEIIEYERKNRGRARVFPFGMGNSVNRFLLDAMAREGRGAVDYVTLGLSKADLDRQWDEEDDATYAARDRQRRDALKEQKSAVDAVERFYKRLETPVLIAPQLAFDGLPVADVNPGAIPDVFETQPVMVTGRFTKAARGVVTLSGFAGDKPWTSRIPVDFGAAKTDNPALESLWARSQIDALQFGDYSGENAALDDKTKEKIIDISLQHRVMTQWTSFVAVEQKIVNPGGNSARSDVPVELPKGLDYEKAVGVSPGAPASAQMRNGISSGGNSFSARPGDPLIQIKAPVDTLRVTAILPDGTPISLLLNPKTGCYEAHFDIPGTASDGDYQVQILIARRGGKRVHYALGYRVDTRAPGGSGQISTRDGRAQLSLQTSDDVKRVAVILPWNQRLEMTRQGSGFAQSVAVPLAWQGQKAKACFVLTDSAHNRTEIWVDWN